MLRQQVKAVSSLLSTMALIGLSVGMTGTLLGIRGAIEGFSTLTIGFIMSAYFIGYLFGSTRAPKDIRRVGYIRAFGGLGALASIAILVQAIWIDPIVWLLMRILSGFALSAMYVIAESWLNTMADNKSRGAMLSVYMVLLYGGIILGQLILIVADPATYIPFVIVAMLLNLSLIPILASVTVEPTILEVKKVPIRLLWQRAPLGVTATFITQACSAMFYGIGPVYASYLGFNVTQITFFMATFITGGMLAQPPLGMLSDRYDRRAVIAACAGSATVIALVLALLNGHQPWLIYLGMALLGACILPMYSLSIAHTNDFLEREQMLGATGTIIKVAGVGSILGAPSVAALMQGVSVHAYFPLMATLAFCIAVSALYRISQSKAPLEQTNTPFARLVPTHGTEEIVHSMIEDGLEEASGTSNTPVVTGPPLDKE